MTRAHDGRTYALAAAALAAAWLAARQARTAPGLLSVPGEARRDGTPPAAIAAPVSPGTDAPPAPSEELRDAPASPSPEGAPAAPRARLRTPRLAPVGRTAPRSASRGGEEASTSRAGARPEARAEGGLEREGVPHGARPTREATRRRVERRSVRRRNDPGSAFHSPEPRPPRAGHSPRARAAAVRRVAAERLSSGPARKRRGAAAGSKGSRNPSGGRRSAATSSFVFRSVATRRGARRNAPRRRARRPRPLLLSKIIGRRPLRPPRADLVPPRALSELDGRKPRRDARGAPVPSRSAGLAAVETFDPAGLPRDRRAAAHWDGRLWHAGAARGLIRAGGWAWLLRDGSRWWALAGNDALLRHDGVWWTKAGGMWFVVHEGQAWAWRRFADLGAEGLFQPASGARMIYSRDFSKVAVSVPGRGAEVFDAASGRLLETVPEARMPRARGPRVPRAEDLPRDVFAR